MALSNKLKLLKDYLDIGFVSGIVELVDELSVGHVTQGQEQLRVTVQGIGGEELVGLVVVGIDLLWLELDIVMFQANALVKGPSVVVLLVRVFKGLVIISDKMVQLQLPRQNPSFFQK